MSLSSGNQRLLVCKNSFPGWSGGNMGPRTLGEIDGLLVPPGKVSLLLTDHLIID